MSLMLESTTNRTMIWLSVSCLFLAVFANADPSTPSQDGSDCNPDTFDKVICENDRLKFCGPTNKVTSTPCIIRGRPAFCNCEKTECVAEKPSCSSDGDIPCSTPNTKLPDNLNCTRFSYCNNDGKKVILQCPGNLVYDPNTQKCTDRGSARCAKVVCNQRSRNLSLIPFPQARNYYLLCFEGIGDVRKCKDDFYAVRNNVCQFDCNLKKETGLFRDTNVERCRNGFFYACKKSGRNYSTVPARCANGKYFDENLSICTETDTC